jgi:hypothetical protein
MSVIRTLALIAAVACNDPPARRSDAVVTAAAGSAASTPAAAGSAEIKHGPAQVVVTNEPEIALPSQESFRLLDAGKGDRAVLRYKLGAARAAVMVRSELKTRHLEGAAFSQPVALPAIRDGFEIELAAASPGQIALRGLVATAATDSPDAAAYLGPWRALLENKRATAAVDDRGAIGEISFDADPNGASTPRARDELIQRLLSLIVPLPSEPIGTGAQWRVVTILRLGSAVAKQTATYTLLARSATRWKIRLASKRVAEQQIVSDPALPPNTSAELIALFRAHDGDVEIDPSLPLIISGTLTVESRLHARLQPAGQPAVDQMFEDTGRVAFTRCRPAAAIAAPRRPATGALTACPDGFAP